MDFSHTRASMDLAWTLGSCSHTCQTACASTHEHAWSLNIRQSQELHSAAGDGPRRRGGCQQTPRSRRRRRQPKRVRECAAVTEPARNQREAAEPRKLPQPDTGDEAKPARRAAASAKHWRTRRDLASTMGSAQETRAEGRTVKVTGRGAEPRVSEASTEPG